MDRGVGHPPLPIAITNTHAVGIAQEAIIHWTARATRTLGDAWMLPVAAETWDGYLNDLNGGHVTREHVARGARRGRDRADRGGLGRWRHRHELLLVQGRQRHRLAAVAWGSRDVHGRRARSRPTSARAASCRWPGVPLGDAARRRQPDGDWVVAPPGAGSVIAIVATDAPLLPDQCKALARRVPLGLARTGTTGSPLLRRPVPRLLHRQPRRVPPGPATVRPAPTTTG